MSVSRQSLFCAAILSNTWQLRIDSDAAGDLSSVCDPGPIFAYTLSDVETKQGTIPLLQSAL